MKPTAPSVPSPASNSEGTKDPGPQGPGSFPAAAEVDELWPGGPKVRQFPGVFPLSSDTAWLGAFVRLNGVRRVCDLGCGGGALFLQLLGRKPDLAVSAIDILPDAVAAAEEDAALAPLLQKACGYLRMFLLKILGQAGKVLGPADESISKIADVYRKVLYVKSASSSVISQAKDRLERYILANPGFQAVEIQFDVETGSLG